MASIVKLGFSSPTTTPLTSEQQAIAEVHARLAELSKLASNTAQALVIARNQAKAMLLCLKCSFVDADDKPLNLTNQQGQVIDYSRSKYVTPALMAQGAGTSLAGILGLDQWCLASLASLTALTGEVIPPALLSGFPDDLVLTMNQDGSGTILPKPIVIPPTT